MEQATLVAGVSLVITLVMGVLGYLMKNKLETMQTSLDKAHDEIVDIKVNYAHKADVTAMKQEILSRFDRLEDKLTGAK